MALTCPREQLKLVVLLALLVSVLLHIQDGGGGPGQTCRAGQSQCQAAAMSRDQGDLVAGWKRRMSGTESQTALLIQQPTGGVI